MQVVKYCMLFTNIYLLAVVRAIGSVNEGGGACLIAVGSAELSVSVMDVN